MNTHDRTSLDDAFPREHTADIAGQSSSDELDQFPSESKASSGRVQSASYVTRNSHYGRALAAAGVAILLGVVIAGVMPPTFTERARTVSTPRTETHAGQDSPRREDSTRLAVTATTLPESDAAGDAVRQAPDTVASPAPAKTATGISRPRSGGSRTTRRQPVRARAAGTRSTRGAQSRRGTSGVAAAQPRAVAPTPETTAADKAADDQRRAADTTTRETAAPDVGAQVSVSTNVDSDELTFRWSAPVGTFADPTASQTRFFCPETPQRVDITVIVTDKTGTSASDTVTVHCVASTR